MEPDVGPPFWAGVAGWKQVPAPWTVSTVFKGPEWRAAWPAPADRQKVLGLPGWRRSDARPLFRIHLHAGPSTHYNPLCTVQWRRSAATLPSDSVMGCAVVPYHRLHGPANRLTQTTSRSR